MNKLLELNKELLKIDDEYKKKINEFKLYEKEYLKSKKSIIEKINYLNNNIDLEKIENGLKILELQFPATTDYSSGKTIYKNIYNDLVESAKKDIVEDCKILKKEYMGYKIYSGFDQRCDCRYGYGPSYGTIYQRIGLKNPSKELTDYDKECCLYLLANLKHVFLKHVLNNKNL